MMPQLPHVTSVAETFDPGAISRETGNCPVVALTSLPMARQHEKPAMEDTETIPTPS